MATEIIGSAGGRYFDRTKYSSLSTIAAREAARIKRHVNDVGTVLEFGCGNGAILASLPAWHRIGIEEDPQAIEDADERGIDVHTTIAAIKTGTIATVVASHSIELDGYGLGALREFKRVLQPLDGMLIMVLPSELWTASGIKIAAEMVGFEVVECYRVAAGESRLVDWLPWQLAALGRRLVALITRRIDIICVCRPERP